jgi:hypothetical protein
MLHRRGFITKSALISLSPLAPAFFREHLPTSRLSRTNGFSSSSNSTAETTA